MSTDMHTLNITDINTVKTMKNQNLPLHVSQQMTQNNDRFIVYTLNCWQFSKFRIIQKKSRTNHLGKTPNR